MSTGKMKLTFGPNQYATTKMLETTYLLFGRDRDDDDLVDMLRAMKAGLEERGYYARLVLVREDEQEVTR